MQLGIVSDTHDDLDAIDRAVAIFEDASVDAVIHCGDVVAPFAATPFDGPWDFHAVRGNNDGEWALQDTVEDFGTYHGEFAHLEFDGLDVAVYHGTSEAIVAALVAAGHYDFVLRGHTHERAHEESGDTTMINPGGLAFPGAPGDPAVAVLDTATEDVSFEDLS